MDVLTVRSARRVAAVLSALLLTLAPAPVAAASSWPVGLAASSRGTAQGDAIPAAPASVTSSCFLIALQLAISWSPVSHASVSIDSTQVGTTDTPFSLTVTAHRVHTPDGWEWDPVLPSGTVTVPGYRPASIPFEAS